MHIGIIIVSYNAKDRIIPCLDTIHKMKKDGMEVSLIVVDNSTDNTAEIVRKHAPEALLFPQKTNTGFAGGNNIGMQVAIDAKCDYVYLLNDDTEVHPDFLWEAMQVMQSSPKVGAVQSKLLLHPRTDLINSLGNKTHYLGYGYCSSYKVPDHFVSDTEITYASGAAVLISMEVLKKVGFFEEEFFMYAEDQDLSWRIQLAGYTIMLSGKSIVYHKYQFSKSIKKFYYMERNRWLLIFMNYKVATVIVLSPLLLMMELGVLLFSIPGGFWREKVRAYGYFFKRSTWKFIWERHQTRKKMRVVRDADILKRFTGKIEFQDVQNPVLKYIANPFFNTLFYLIKCVVVW